jgi:acetyl/propionyl-CoA carboxylase alpha subunit
VSLVVSATRPSAVLVVDRGAAAVRVLKALQSRGVKAVSVHIRDEATALHATLADESVLLGKAVTAYSDVVSLVEAARQSGVDAVHPVTVRLAGLQEAVGKAGLQWLGNPLEVPVELAVGDGVVEARCADALSVLPPVAARSAEVVTGLDLTLAALTGTAEGIAREGVAVSVDVLATRLATVTALELPEIEDVWWDPAVDVCSTPTDPLLLVLTAWGPDRDTSYSRAREAWDQLVITGPTVPRPVSLGGTSS